VFVQQPGQGFLAAGLLVTFQFLQDVVAIRPQVWVSGHGAGFLGDDRLDHGDVSVQVDG
jgi:hypothetical protein